MTADLSNPAGWATLMVAALMGLVAVFIVGKKKEKYIINRRV